MVTKIGNAINTPLAFNRPQEVKPAGDGILKNWWYKYDQLAKDRTNNLRGFKPKKDGYQYDLPKDDGDGKWWNDEQQLFFYLSEEKAGIKYARPSARRRAMPEVRPLR